MVDPQFKMRDGKIEPDTTRHRKSSPGFSKGALGLFENRLLEDPRFFFLNGNNPYCNRSFGDITAISRIFFC